KEGPLEKNVADPCVSDLQTQPEHRMSPAPKLSPQLQPFPMEQALSQLQPNFQPSISPPVIQMADYSFRAFSQSPQTHGATQPVGQFCAGNDGNGHVQVYRDLGQAMQEVTEGQGLRPEIVADAANRDEWERAEDPRTGRVYDINHKTKNTTWDAPHASPRAWVDPRKHAASLPWSASAASHQPLSVPKAPAPVRKRFSMFGFSSGQ
ncbi:MAG: WW domain-containing protein, partial [Promethearchaeia archaeon]